MTEGFFGKSTNHKKVFSVIIAIIILTAIPLTIYLVSLNKPQDLRSRANTKNDVEILTKQLLSNVGDDAVQISTATTRKEKMKNLGKEDPEAFLLEVISEDIKRELPIPAQEVIEKKVEIDGILLENVVEEDSPEVNNQRSSRSLIFQEIDNEGNTKNTYEVYLREGQSPDIAGRTKIKGYLIDNVLIPISIEKSNTVLGITTSGSLQIAVIMVNFKENLSDTRNEFTPQILEKLYFSDPGSVSNYIKNTSHGKLTFQGDINDIYGWLTLKGYTRKQVCDIYEKRATNKGFIKKINQMAKVKATSRGKVFSDYDIIAYVFPAVKEESKNDDGTNCYWNAITKGIPGDSVVDPIHFLNGDYDGVNDVNHGVLDGASSIKFYSGILAHEVGHSLGLSHAHGLLCGNKPIAPYQNCTLYNYGDRFDLIGGAWDYHSHTNAKNKLMQGWISPNNLQTITSSGEYTLYSSSKTRTDQIQLLKIARPTDGGNFYLEYKSKNNGDGDAPSYIYSGAILRLSDEDLPKIKNERGVYQDEWRIKQTYLIDVDKNDTSGRGGLMNPTFKDSLVFDDTRNKITIKQLSHNAESVKLSVTLGPPPCEKNDPSLAITEPVLSGKAGEKISYELSITNNDSLYCPKATFDLSAQAPNDWLVEFPTNGFALTPLEATKIKAYITSSALTGIEGNPYKIQITVKNRVAAGFMKTKETRYNIEQSPTPTPTNIPPATATPKPTSDPSLTPNPTVTPTLSPTLTQSPTIVDDSCPPFCPPKTTFKLGAKIVGIGVNAGENNSPIVKTLDVTIKILGPNSTPILELPGTLNYNNSTGIYSNTIPAEKVIKTGFYNIYVKAPSYLVKRIDMNLKQGSENNLSQVVLSGGDINEDGSRNLLDWNLIHACSDSLSHDEEVCERNEKYGVNSDMNKDGIIDIANDLQLWLREFRNFRQ